MVNIVEKCRVFSLPRLRESRFYIKGFLMISPIGYLNPADGGYTMNEAGNVLNPDVGYISKTRSLERPEQEAPVPPDLAVEIKSPTDRITGKRGIRAKAKRYLDYGTKPVRVRN